MGTGSRVGGRQSIRVAYVGPTPRKGAGGPRGCAWLVLEELARSGVRLDLYLTVTEDRKEIAALGVVARSEGDPGLQRVAMEPLVQQEPPDGHGDGNGSTSLGRRRLVNLLVEQHKLVPYDVMYQFSTIEVFGRRRDRQKLPTMVLHPSVHAAGELQWMWNERELSRRCEGWLRPRLVMGWLLFRSRRQRRDIGRAALVLALSDAFGRSPRRGGGQTCCSARARQRPGRCPAAGDDSGTGASPSRVGASATLHSAVTVRARSASIAAPPPHARSDGAPLWEASAGPAVDRKLRSWRTGTSRRMEQVSCCSTSRFTNRRRPSAMVPSPVTIAMRRFLLYQRFHRHTLPTRITFAPGNNPRAAISFRS